MAYDTIVIGAGHNGLTTAALLAKAGQSVLVLEADEAVGGVARSHEFWPGYKTAGLLHDTGAVRPHVVEALALQEHGLRLRESAPDVLAASGDGESFVLRDDVEATATAIATLSQHDAEQYPRYVDAMAKIAPVLRDLFDRPAVDIVDIESESLWGLAKRGLAVRRLGKADMLDLLRVPVMCVADIVGEWFEHDLVKAALALPALAGAFTGPWSPGNAMNLLRHEALAGPGVVGGGPALVRALEAAATAQGVEIRTGARVDTIRTGADGVTGVVLDDGTSLDARRVAASCSPKATLLSLLPIGAIEYRLEHHARTFRSRGSTAHVAFAMRGPVRFAGQSAVRVRTAGHLDDLERAYDAIKYGHNPGSPVLDIHVPTVETPALAPDGHHVVSATVYFAPSEHADGWTDTTREEIGERVQAVLSRLSPGFADRIEGHEVLSPADLEARWRLPGGHLFHGEHSLDQLIVRPSPDCLHYRTPVPGLWLCGSGSHPGGGLTCGPGSLAARAILAEA
ncbi:MAG: NAD(P)/FAD-dependent oxidoreductase [Myxococcota bacterium]